MENKKELGLGWYEFLRYFPFGLLRITSFLSLAFGVLVFLSEKTTLAFIALIFAICDFVFRVVIHRHLENYSTNVFNSLLLFYIVNTIYWILNFLPDYDALVAFFTPTLLNGLLCLINYKYFKKRSHIFINECNFMGKITHSAKLKKANIFDDVCAVGNVQKIKEGKEVELSVSQITTLIINLQDAKANLNKEEFNEVEALYNLFRKNTTKIKMNAPMYLNTCISIIRDFDEIAPYEKYSGGDASEFALLMGEIRNKNIDEIRKTRKQIKDVEYYINNTKPYFESIQRGEEKLLSYEELNALVMSGKMTKEKMEDYLNAKEIAESMPLMENILGTDFHENTLKDLKEQLEILRNDGTEFNNVPKEKEIAKTEYHNNFCRKCGTKLVEDCKFCHKCGTEVL